MAEKLFVSEDVRIVHGDSEVLVESDVDDGSKIVIVPMDDCIVEVVWSHEHERLVGVVRDIPIRD